MTMTMMNNAVENDDGDGDIIISDFTLRVGYGANFNNPSNNKRRK